MNKEIIEALGQIEKETGIAKDELIDMMKESVLHAFHKNYGEDSRAEVQIAGRRTAPGGRPRGDQWCGPRRVDDVEHDGPRSPAALQGGSLDRKSVV